MASGMSRIATCNVCGTKSRLYGGGRWYCPRCNTMHDIPSGTQFDTQAPGEERQTPEAPPAPARPPVWADVQERVREEQSRGTTEPAAQGSRTSVLRQQRDSIISNIEAVLTVPEGAPSREGTPAHRQLQAQLSGVLDEIRQLGDWSDEDAAAVTHYLATVPAPPGPDVPAEPEVPAKPVVEPAEAEPESEEPEVPPPSEQLALTISGVVPEGDTGFYECNGCGNRIGMVAGNEVPPCGRCDAAGIQWLKVRDADEEEVLAPMAPPADRPVAPKFDATPDASDPNEAVCTLSELATELDMGIGEVAKVAKAAGITGVRRGKDPVTNAQRGQILTVLRGQSGAPLDEG